MVQPKLSVSEFLALKAGSADARDFFVEKYGGGIFRIVDSIVDDPALAEEITTATFEKVQDNLHKFKNEIHFHRWLIRTAKNRALSIIRAGGPKKRAEQIFVSINETATPADNTEVPPEKKEANKDQYFKKMWEAIKKLPKRQNMVFTMRFIDEKSTEFIAKKLNISEQTVRNHITKARISLRKELAGLDF